MRNFGLRGIDETICNDRSRRAGASQSVLAGRTVGTMEEKKEEGAHKESTTASKCLHTMSSKKIIFIFNVFVHTHVRVCRFVCLCMHMCVPVHMGVSMNICMWERVCTHICVKEHVCVPMCQSLCVCVSVNPQIVIVEVKVQQVGAILFYHRVDPRNHTCLSDLTRVLLYREPTSSSLT